MRDFYLEFDEDKGQYTSQHGMYQCCHATYVLVPLLLQLPQIKNLKVYDGPSWEKGQEKVIPIENFRSMT